MTKRALKLLVVLSVVLIMLLLVSLVFFPKKWGDFISERINHRITKVRTTIKFEGQRLEYNSFLADKLLISSPYLSLPIEITDFVVRMDISKSIPFIKYTYKAQGDFYGGKFKATIKTSATETRFSGSLVGAQLQNHPIGITGLKGEIGFKISSLIIRSNREYSGRGKITINDGLLPFEFSLPLKKLGIPFGEVKIPVIQAIKFRSSWIAKNQFIKISNTEFLSSLGVLNIQGYVATGIRRVIQGNMEVRLTPDGMNFIENTLPLSLISGGTLEPGISDFRVSARGNLSLPELKFEPIIE